MASQATMIILHSHFHRLYIPNMLSVIGHWSLSTKEICLCTSITFAQCSPRTAQAGYGRGQFMHVVCICITIL